MRRFNRVPHDAESRDYKMNNAHVEVIKKLSAAFSKVPEITLTFWVAKLLTTAMGEATSDYLVTHLNPYLAVGLGAAGFFAALLLQLAVKRYITWIYWLVVVMVSIFGTMAADVVHIVLGIPYVLSASFFVVVLVLTFAVWKYSEKTVSIHSITTPRRELFYWATVIATFALGTATGDMTASTFNLGYSGAALLFTILFAIGVTAYVRLGWNEIFTFWFSYVMTRPMGASFADWFDKPSSMGGFGYGDGLVSLVLTALIVAVVAYLSGNSQTMKNESMAGNQCGMTSKTVVSGRPGVAKNWGKVPRPSAVAEPSDGES